MVEPITVEEARAHLRIDGTDEDTAIARYIRDARDWVEVYTGHILVRREVTETFSDLRRVRLRAWPIAADAVPVVVAAGQPVAGAALVVGNRPVHLVPAAGATFPRIAPAVGAVSVRVTAGYADASQIPGIFMRAMLLLIGGYHADREGGDVFVKAEEAAKSLCRAKRWWAV